MKPRARFFLLYALLAATFALTAFYRNAAVPTARPLDSLPRVLGEWTLRSSNLYVDDVLQTLRPTDYLSRTYENARGRRVDIYVGYHDGASSGAVHSPRLCLPGSGWNVLEETRDVLRAGGREIPVVWAVYQKGESRELFLYWYRVVGEDLSSTYLLKWKEFTNALFHGRKDAALIRINLPVTDDAVVMRQTMSRFLEAFYPAVTAILPARP